MNTIKAVAFQYEPDQSVKQLLQTFRMMVNHALCIGMQTRIHNRFRLIRAVYEHFKSYGLHTHYTLGACEVASAILKNRRKKHRAPVARRLFLRLDNQTYQLRGEALRIPSKPRKFLTVRLKLGEYQRRFLEDSFLKLGSITLTETKLIVAFEKARATYLDYDSVLAYDTNELSLDGAFSNRLEIKPLHLDMRELARIRAFHFERRRQIQRHLACCKRRLRLKLARYRNCERRRIDAILHRIAKKQEPLRRQTMLR